MRNSYRKHTFLLVLVLVSWLCGCSSSNTVFPEREEREGVVDTAAPVSEQLFELVKTFYCTYGAWPLSWEELQASGLFQNERRKLLEAITAVEMKSPRAVVLIVSYRDASGVVRKSAFLAPPSCGTGPSEGQGEQRMLMAGGRVSFGLSQAFRMLSRQEIQERWKSPPMPDAAWINSDDIVLAIRFGELEVGREELSELLDTLADAYEQAIPSLRWIQREVVSQNGNSYLVHEFESEGARDLIATGVVSTSFDNKLVSVTVTGKKSLLVDVEALTSELLAGMRFN